MDGKERRTEVESTLVILLSIRYPFLGDKMGQGKNMPVIELVDIGRVKYRGQQQMLF